MPSRYPLPRRLGRREDRAGIGVEAHPVDRASEAPAAVIVQVAPEARLAGRVGPIGPVEAHVELIEAAAPHRAMRGLHTVDQCHPCALVAAIGGVGCDWVEVHLVRDLESDHSRVGAEPPHDLADEPHPCVDVPLLLRRRVVAELKLHAIPALRVEPRQLQEMVDALLPVRPEEAIQAQDERPLLGAQLAKRRERLGVVDRRQGDRRADRPGAARGVDPHAQVPPGQLRHACRGRVAGAWGGHAARAVTRGGGRGQCDRSGCQGGNGQSQSRTGAFHTESCSRTAACQTQFTSLARYLGDPIRPSVTYSRNPAASRASSCEANSMELLPASGVP